MVLLWNILCFQNIVMVVTSSSTIGTSSSNYGNNAELLLSSPISTWQASWTASQAHGTVMAMMVQDNQRLVMVGRSPSTNVYRPPYPVEESHKSSNTMTVLGGLHVQRIQTENFGNNIMVQYAPSWFPVGTTTFSTMCYCGMTGLAMDVEHLCRTVQKFADDYYNVYQTHPSTHVMTTRLAKILSLAASTQEQRLYGVQVLMVGVDNNNNSRGDNGGGGGGGSGSRLCMYSIDPSGTWQSWGKACAIGKYAQQVRGILGKKIRTMSSTKELSEMDVPQALELLLQCWIQVCRQPVKTTTIIRETEDWDVFVVQRDPDNPSQCELFQVPKEEVMAIIDKVLLATG
jgi:20S proteasome alpha/beta subunit